MKIDQTIMTPPQVGAPTSAPRPRTADLMPVGQPERATDPTGMTEPAHSGGAATLAARWVVGRDGLRLQWNLAAQARNR